MTRYTDIEDNEFNTFISSSVQQLKHENICYVYNKNQIEIIKKAIKDKLKKNIIVKENECGYTLRIERGN